MFPFSKKTNLILACQLTGAYDVNRGEILPSDEYDLVSDWAESIVASQLNGIIFHNNFSDETVSAFQNDRIKFISVNAPIGFNPNVARYLIYRDFLLKYAEHIDNLFITDVSDVVVVNNPFKEPLYTANPTHLFCGDEPKQLQNEWMQDHSFHLRENIEDYESYEEQFKTDTLLNCGIIGGSISVMQPFISQLCDIHENYNHNNKTPYTGDMGAFNYLARTKFNDHLIHGAPVNTVFKAYENDRNDCWFRHK